MSEAHKGQHSSPGTEFKKGHQLNLGKSRGGITPLLSRLRHTKNYKIWKSAVFERDNWTCQTCQERGLFIEAHHIIEMSKMIRECNIKSIEEAVKCMPLWNVDNGVTLCEGCHNITKKSRIT